jgi:hypothetical protein
MDIRFGSGAGALLAAPPPQPSKAADKVNMLINPDVKRLISCLHCYVGKRA